VAFDLFFNFFFFIFGDSLVEVFGIKSVIDFFGGGFFENFDVNGLIF